ncbi:MAG: NADH:flavin oxidoreductase [Dehalococcoidia bacterium]|nr:NADH:flavin oxidoreductase [Dehalococcoidia bacterium]
MKKYESLFQPIKIGRVEVKNRIGLAPMNLNYTREGYVSEQQLAYYAARAKGGTGLIFTEAMRTSEEDTRRSFYDNLHLWKAAHQKGLTELVETVHYFGAKLFVQMNIGPGPQATSKKAGLQPRAASPVPFQVQKDCQPKALLPMIEKGIIYYGWKGETPREMTVEEIHTETEQFAKSAKMAFVAGADGIEIHFAHGYLGHSFLSPRFNKRTDQYGGSLENRMRFLREVLQATRKLVGDKPTVGVRISSDEHMPGGLTNQDVQKIVKALEKDGLDFYHQSCGTEETMLYFFPDEDGMGLDDIKAIKAAVNIPCLAYSLHDPDTVNKAVSEGMCDMVILGRPLLADAEWANKVSEGRIKDIAKCKRDLWCLVRLLQGLPSRCTQNPDLGRERYMPEYLRGPSKMSYWRSNL